MSSKMCRGGHVMFRCSFCHQVTSKAKFAPLTNVQIFRNASDTRTRYNDIKVQMLSESLHNQIFSGNRCSSTSHATKLQDVIEHLKSHDLWNKNTTILPEVNFKLPELKDSAIDDHFRQLAQRQIAPHVEGMRYLTAHDLPPMPKKWVCQAGWTKYQRDGSVVQVDYPADDALVFDVEILVKEGNFPTMATAASPDAWYSWCSDRILKDKFKWNKTPTLQDLIPLETTRGSPEPGVQDWPPRTVVGHNVSFDRSFIKEQYYIKGSSMKFVDTMALHIAISGLTSFQRILYQARKSGSKRKEVLEEESKAARFGPPNLAWMDVSSLNNLNDVYQLHCRGPALKKPIREVFVEGSMQDVREQFQVLMTYCAGDVFATHAVVSKLWPQFFERFPHPVTLAGMLQMSTAYLPINANWQTYIQQSEETYQDLQRELKELLKRLANDACQFMHGKKYLHDPWLWDLDWSTRELKLKAGKAVGKKTQQPLKGKEEETAEDRVNRILKTEERLPKRPPHMPGYPAWYAELCPKPSEMNGNFEPGPAKISTQRRVVPKLLRLTWDGFPLHYSDKHGWGYLVPGRENAAVADVELDDQTPRYPTESLYEVCKPILSKAKLMDQKLVLQEDIRHLYDKLDLEELSLTGDEKNRLWEKIWDKEQEVGKLEKKSGLQQDKADRPSYHTGDGPYNDVEIPGCWFFKIPHKDGLGHRVGNPLAKDFISKVEDKVLQATSGGQADMVLNLSKMCSYWKNNKDRISSQMVLTLDKKELPEAVIRDKDYNEEEGGFGAILPRVVTAGTVTRRAVEPTWLTASNAYRDRVGSELKAMVQTPPGYHFVGADVDSQELWIAAILGDAHFAGTHGCTAFGWMTLQGKKSEGTDLHSKVASLVGITRDQAKIFNYGRIYGAGQKFAQRLLMQFNHRLTMKEAYDKARAMYLATKGKKARKNKKAVELNDGSDNSKVQAGMWHGGSESAMFNKLELIARSQRPRTPVLGARISCCLEPKNVDEDFMTSRINWVVQSSAVDYLHLMLVSMRWLFEEFDIDGRFCISIHDEVRYMVKSSDRYRAALALQITNLLTRSMFAYKLDMDDLPQSVAFFSAVDIDKCMRKEVKMDCKTPSNPHGLQGGYAIPEGEALDIYQILEKTNRTPERDKQPACDEAGGGQDLYHELESMEMS